MENILEKTQLGNLDKNFAITTQKINSQVIYHLHMTPSTILLALKPFATHFNVKLVFIPEKIIFYGLSK